MPQDIYKFTYVPLNNILELLGKDYKVKVERRCAYAERTNQHCEAIRGGLVVICKIFCYTGDRLQTFRTLS